MAKDFPKVVEGKGAMRASEGRRFVEGLGQSMKALDGVVRELARSEVPVLLLGENGAGKKATAERIHQMSPHQAEPFQVVCCAAMTEAMFGHGQSGDGELFGAGTVYLEEIADLSPECQEALLNSLNPIEGNGQARPARARLIC